MNRDFILHLFENNEDLEVLKIFKELVNEIESDNQIKIEDLTIDQFNKIKDLYIK